MQKKKNETENRSGLTQNKTFRKQKKCFGKVGKAAEGTWNETYWKGIKETLKGKRYKRTEGKM